MRASWWIVKPPFKHQHLMPDTHANENARSVDERDGARRVLLVADGDGGGSVRERLATFGMEVGRASSVDAPEAVGEFSPSLVLVAFGERDDESRLITLARRLRAAPETFALPIIFLFRTDERSLRSAALHIGVDDYFACDSRPEELRARLESVLWRAEAGRRAAPVVGEQRIEIDNFIFLLDSVGEDAKRGLSGAISLMESPGDDIDVDGRALVAAHGFLKLNLRRVDAVAFYGPRTLLVYLPHRDARAARDEISRLRREFLEGEVGRELIAGVTSFPSGGGEIEKLIEQAEVALAAVREGNSNQPVIVYEDAAASSSSRADARAQATDERRAAFAPRGEAAVREPHAQRQRARRLMLAISNAERMAQINLLMRSEGYEVRAAFDAQHALNLLRIDRPDLLLVDYELNGMNGIEMFERLKKQSGERNAPPTILMLPGGRGELSGVATAAGVRGLVELPYDPVELLDSLREVGDSDSGGSNRG